MANLTCPIAKPSASLRSGAEARRQNIVDSHAIVPNRQIAMLIDGDNAQPSLLEAMLAEIGKYGLVTIRRIYGDWTTQNMKGWKEALHVHAIQPFQQFRYTVGKNATDSAMIIDAMDILYSGTVSGFCLVSSDSDYTRLATRIREKGLLVMGIGKKTTPAPLSMRARSSYTQRTSRQRRNRITLNLRGEEPPAYRSAQLLPLSPLPRLHLRNS